MTLSALVLLQFSYLGEDSHYKIIHNWYQLKALHVIFRNFVEFCAIVLLFINFTVGHVIITHGQSIKGYRIFYYWHLFWWWLFMFLPKSFHVLKQLERHIGTKRCTLVAFLLACELKIFKWRLHSPRRNDTCW